MPGPPAHGPSASAVPAASPRLAVSRGTQPVIDLDPVGRGQQRFDRSAHPQPPPGLFRRLELPELHAGRQIGISQIGVQNRDGPRVFRVDQQRIPHPFGQRLFLGGQAHHVAQKIARPEVDIDQIAHVDNVVCRRCETRIGAHRPRHVQQNPARHPVDIADQENRLVGIETVEAGHLVVRSRNCVPFV